MRPYSFEAEYDYEAGTVHVVSHDFPHLCGDLPLVSDRHLHRFLKCRLVETMEADRISFDPVRSGMTVSHHGAPGYRACTNTTRSNLVIMQTDMVPELAYLDHRPMMRM